MTKEVDWLLREKYHGEKTPSFFADCARLEAGEPLAYIIGTIPFLGCDIALDSQPLIPRPETEFWAEKAITQIKGSSPKVLDLCAGSGAIGVAVAKAIPSAQVTFAEIDPAHLPTIKSNIEQNLFTIPVNWNSKEVPVVVSSDLFDCVEGFFDYILTNPPYIDQAAHTVDASVVTHEPHLALFGGQNGLEIIERIIAHAPAHLTHGGQLWIEHEPFQSTAIRELATTHGFSCETKCDQYDTERYSVLTLGVAE